MSMPIDVVFVRHGESEGNRASALSKRGNDSMFTPEFLGRHSSTWRLTEKGRGQALVAGDWIRQNIKQKFFRYYVSSYYRAMETAALLGLPEAQWMITYYLRERDWGLLDVMSFDERRRRFKENLQMRDANPFYWTPLNGESMPTLCLRLEKILDTLHRECGGQSVILVVHGEVMWGMRYLIERMTQADISRLEHSKDPRDKIHNCQIVHYTRRDPELGIIGPHLNWVRSICPTDLSLSTNEWRRIVRRKFSNEELLSLLGQRD